MVLFKCKPVLVAMVMMSCSHVQSCLEMRDKTVGDCMTPLESVFMLSNDDCIGTGTMDKVGRYLPCESVWIMATMVLRP